VIKAFVELFRYDETTGFTKNLKGSIATLLFLKDTYKLMYVSQSPSMLFISECLDLILSSKSHKSYKTRDQEKHECHCGCRANLQYNPAYTHNRQ
jgi:hypothetical protein